LAKALTIAVISSGEEGKVLLLETGARRYQLLSARRLTAIRVTAGFSVDKLARALTDVLGQNISARQLEAWESGEPFMAGILPAALDVTGVTEAEIIGLKDPDWRDINRLEFAVGRARALLNDPAALLRRASELLEGNARPVFT
jgi:transcriptional regulator with XRE-family HTH domain